MSNEKISALAAVTTPVSTDEFAVNQAGTTKKMTLDQIGSGGIATKYAVVSTFTSAGINAAIDALGTTGGEVYIPEGDYDCTAVITIDAANTTLRGAGKGTRLLATNRFVYSTVTGTPAAGETLTGDTSGYTATVVQVDTTNKIVWYHTISNATNFTSGEVISWSGGADTTLVGAPTEQSFDVISNTAKDYMVVSDLCIYGGSGGGNAKDLIVTTGKHNTIKNCYLYESDQHGISGAAVSDYADYLNNYIENTDLNGIAIDTADWELIQGNTISGAGDTGIRANATEFARIVDNHIEDSGQEGINLRIGVTSLIANNTIEDTTSGYADIIVNNSAFYNVVSGNVCIGSGTSDKGIHLDDAEECIVTGNFTDLHDVAGIQEDSDCQNNVIFGNNCQDTTPYVLNGIAAEALNIGQSGIVSKPDEITAVSGAGTAASITTLNTEVTTNDDDDLDVVTLAAGTSGQIKHIYCVASFAGDTWKITPATMAGGTQITFGDNSVGTGCTLVYADSEGWCITGNNGGTVA